MSNGHFKKLLSLVLVLAIAVSAVNAADESYMQTMSGKIKKGDSCTVTDDKFLNLPLDQWNLVRNLSVNNFITFELRQDTNIYYYNKAFTCTLTVSIKYFSSRDQLVPTEVNNISLTVKYDTATGRFYPVYDRYVFKNAYKVTVVVDSITSPEWGDKLPAVFRIKNQILVQRKYPFSQEVNAKLGLALSGNDQSVSANRITPGPPVDDHLTISWDPTDFTNYPNGFGAPEEYDLEWTYIDNLSDRAISFANNSVTAQQVNDFMRFDNSRVTVTATSYKIDLAFTDGYIVTRVRGAWNDDVTGIRQTTNWQNINSSGQIAFTAIDFHEQNLNWQYTVSYAEEGKRKEVISYFDGSLRSRQAVTISNSELTLVEGSTTERSETAIVQETVYDNMGRPSVSILPAPVRSSILKYYPAFNKNGAGSPYNYTDISSVTAGNTCTIKAGGLNTSSGAAQYYSPNNAFIGDPDYYFTKYVPNSVGPDTKGYPLALTEYIPDNTGRIRRQGGVGYDFGIGSGHETNYFYGKPLQSELDRLFGMEVGTSSHYLKNMVIDANGQASVSYIDAAGKTIATALAGVAPGNVDQLPSALEPEARKTMTQILMRPVDFQVNPATLSKEGAATFLAAIKNVPFTVHYSIDPASLINSVTSQPWNGPVAGQQFCSNCYYEIQIIINDDCGIPVSPTPFSTTAFQLNSVTCSPNAQPITGSVTFTPVKLGEYTVTYRLRLSEDVIKFQTDYYINNNIDLKTLQYFFEQELFQTDLLGCYSDCQSCKKLEEEGGLPAFIIKVKALFQKIKDEKYPASLYPDFNIESDNINNWISQQYNDIMGNCEGILGSCVLSPCGQKLEMMKNDVRPGGQYLLYDAQTYTVLSTETAVSILYYNNGVALNYKNDPQITDYEFEDENGINRHIKDAGVTETMFIKAYLLHPEWADDFVKRHIEYCSYLWCIYGTNETSYTFDERLREEISKGQKAIDAGFYDPYNPNGYLQLSNIDPFFNGGSGSGYKTQFQNDLAILSDILKIKIKDLNGNYLPAKNILQLVDWILYCKPADENATVTDFINSWNCTPDASCRSLTREWELYRNYYLKIKSKYVRLAKIANNPGCDNCFIGQDAISASICEDPGNLSDYTIIGGPLSKQLVYQNGSAPFKGDYRIKLRYDPNGDYYYINVIKGAMFADVSSLGQPADPIWTIIEIKCQNGHPQPSCDDPGGSGDGFVCPTGEGNYEVFIDSDPQNPCNGSFGAALIVNYLGTNLPFPSYERITIYITVVPWVGSPHNFSVILDNNTGSGYACISLSDVGPDIFITGVKCDPIGPPPPPPVPPSSSCKENPLYPLYSMKVRIFNDFVDEQGYLNCFINNAPANQAEIDALMAASIAAMRQQAIQNLDALKQNWIDRLRSVVREENENDIQNGVTPRFLSLADPDETTINPVILNLVNNLYPVAYRYIEIAPKENIRPASTLPAGEVASNGYHNFTEVFNTIIGISLVQKGFGPHLLTQPYPYDKTPVLSSPDVSELNTGICLQVTTMKNRWITAGSPGSFHSYLKNELGDDFILTVNELNDLETRCASNCKLLNESLLLPAVFAPAIPTNTGYAPWVTCTQINNLYSSFQSTYPDVASGTKLYRNLLVNYMNASLGYALSFDEYDDFKNTICIANSNAVLYAKPASPLIQSDNNLACAENILRNVFDKAGQEYEYYIETERRKFRNAYISKCLSSNASAKLEGEQYEYHYTLYYYDQSGNLVKTIPPEGVKLLSDDELELVEDFRNEDPSVCTGAGIPNSESATETFNALSNGLQSTNPPATTHGTEMWLYSASGNTRQVRIITPDHKYFYQVVIYQDKLWAELYSLQESGAGNNEITITLSNHAFADLSGMAPLQPWTHLFIQSEGSLTGGLLELYLDGVKLTTVTGTAPPYPFEWEINSTTGSYILPAQDISVLKHFRIYNRTAQPGEILANYKNICLSPVNNLSVQVNPLQFWGRFNIPSYCANPSTVDPQYESEIPNNGSLKISSDPASFLNTITTVSNNFTVEFWVNPQLPHEIDAEATSGYGGVTGQRYALYPTWGTYFGATASTMGVSVGTNGVSVYEHADNYMPPLLVWPGTVSGWTHVAIVYQNKTPNLYINGQLVRTGLTSPRSVIYPSYNFGTTFGLDFKGSLDEVRIWSTVRTPAEIAANYLKAVSPDAAGLTAYWPMSQTDNTTVNDIACSNSYDFPIATGSQQWQALTSPVMDRTVVEYASHFIVPDHKLPTNYAYNSLNQVIKQSSPDGGIAEFWYDRLGRLAVSQNAEQKQPTVVNTDNPANRYSYTQYDLLGRIIEVGEKISATTDMTEDLARSSGLPNWITNVSNGSKRQITYTVYDQAPFWAPASITGQQHNLRKRVAATALISAASNSSFGLLAALTGSRVSSSYYSYDLTGNVNTLVQENTAMGVAEAGGAGLKQIKYEYDLQSGKVNKVLYQDGKWDQFYYQYIYDADNRVIKALSSRTNIGDASDDQLWVPEATYRYYLHGPLARMELGRDKVQGVDYAYTLQGWLKGVNSQILDPDKDMSGDGKHAGTGNFGDFGRDVFGFSLGYYMNDYSPIGGSGAPAFGLNYLPPVSCAGCPPDQETGKQLFNGNISHATYAIKQLENGITVGYTYRYDQLNRITGMRRNNITAGATAWSNASVIDAYKEEISYDANGNIKTNLRNGANMPAGTNGNPTTLPLQMDNLTYGYNVDFNGRLVNNKLRHVKDAVDAASYSEAANGTADIDNQADDNYQYDNIGNLISDNAENLQRINWTVYGKIASITKGSTTISYTYDASGNRISKTVINGGVATTTFYVRDAQGTVLGVYKNSGNTYNWQEQHLYGSSRLGMVTPNVDYPGTQPYNYTASNDPVRNGLAGMRIYELSNHLGNVLATVSDIKVGQPDGHFEAQVLSANDYYPFGMMMPGRKYSAAGGYRYGFNGKENDNEVKGEGNQQDYGMRIYDTRLGRFLSVDPIGKNFPMLTPYQFSSNSPIQNIDLDGKEGTRSKIQINGHTLIEVVNIKVYVNVTNNAGYANGIFAGNAYENKAPIVNELHSYLNESYNQGQDMYQTYDNPINKNEFGDPVYYNFDVIPIESANKADYENHKNRIREESPAFDDNKEIDSRNFGTDFVFIKLDKPKNGVAEHKGEEILIDPTRYADRNLNKANLFDLKTDVAHEMGHKMLSRNPDENVRKMGPKGDSEIAHNLLGGFMSYGHGVNLTNGGRIVLMEPENKVSQITTKEILRSVTPIPNKNLIIHLRNEKPQ